jgi:hypothetical protein
MDHAVLIVGYGTDTKLGKSYWTVKNSWAADWGEKGYIRMVRGKDQCGVEDNGAYPTGARAFDGKDGPTTSYCKKPGLPPPTLSTEYSVNITSSGGGTGTSKGAFAISYKNKELFNSGYNVFDETNLWLCDKNTTYDITSFDAANGDDTCTKNPSDLKCPFDRDDNEIMEGSNLMEIKQYNVTCGDTLCNLFHYSSDAKAYAAQKTGSNGDDEVYWYTTKDVPFKEIQTMDKDEYTTAYTNFSPTTPEAAYFTVPASCKKSGEKKPNFSSNATLVQVLRQRKLARLAAVKEFKAKQRAGLIKFDLA